MADKKAMSRDDELYLESLYCAIREYILQDPYMRRIECYGKNRDSPHHFGDIYYYRLLVRDDLYGRVVEMMENYDIGDRPSDILEFMSSHIPF